MTEKQKFFASATLSCALSRRQIDDRLYQHRALPAGSTHPGTGEVEMPMFRKKPVQIEARQFVGGKGHKALLNWINEHAKERAFAVTDGGRVDFLVIPTLEGNHRADIGDWIIKGVAGEFYPCKPEIFEATYEAA